MDITFTPKTIRTGLAILLCAATGLSTLRAAPDKPDKSTPAKDAPSATPLPSPSASLDATDANAVRAHLNEVVEVHGTPAATGQSKSGGVFYLNFGAMHQALAVVFFGKSNSATGITSENDLKQYVGKNVSVTGKLSDFKGDLQINVNTADQIKILPAP